MKIILLILDYILLPRETRVLSKINELGFKFNDLINKGGVVNYNFDKEELKSLKESFSKIKTKEHTDKIEFYIYMITNLLGQEKKN